MMRSLLLKGWQQASTHNFPANVQLLRFHQVATPQVKTFRKRVRVDPITLTDAAVERVRFLLQRNPDATGVRLGVRTRGCNGLSYTLDYFTGNMRPSEEVVETKGIKVVIEPKALMHLVGTTMDYKEDAISAEFVFQNPNAKGSCGCGESFNV